MSYSSLITDEKPIRDWLTKELTPFFSISPTALSKYVYVLLRKYFLEEDFMEIFVSKMDFMLRKEESRWFVVRFKRCLRYKMYLNKEPSTPTGSVTDDARSKRAKELPTKSDNVGKRRSSDAVRSQNMKIKRERQEQEDDSSSPSPVRQKRPRRAKDKVSSSRSSDQGRRPRSSARRSRDTARRSSTSTSPSPSSNGRSQSCWEQKRRPGRANKSQSRQYRKDKGSSSRSRYRHRSTSAFRHYRSSQYRTSSMSTEQTRSPPPTMHQEGRTENKSQFHGGLATQAVFPDSESNDNQFGRPSGFQLPQRPGFEQSIYSNFFSGGERPIVVSGGGASSAITGAQSAFQAQPRESRYWVFNQIGHYSGRGEPSNQTNSPTSAQPQPITWCLSNANAVPLDAQASSHKWFRHGINAPPAFGGPFGPGQPQMNSLPSSGLQMREPARGERLPPLPFIPGMRTQNNQAMMGLNRRQAGCAPPSNGDNCTLLVQGIPEDGNSVIEVAKYFTRFGRVLSVQICVKGDPQRALVSFSSPAEAEHAYRLSQPGLIDWWPVHVLFSHHDENKNMSESHEEEEENHESRIPVKLRLGWNYHKRWEREVRGDRANTFTRTVHNPVAKQRNYR